MTAWRTRLLQFLLARVLRAPLPVVGCALALAALSVLYTATHLQFQTDRNELVSAARRDRRLVAERLREFGERDGLVVVVENRDRTDSITFLEALARRLEQDRPFFAEIFYRIDPKQFADRALLYLDVAQLEALREGLEGHGRFIEDLARSPDLPTFFHLVNQRITLRLVGGLFTGFLESDSEMGPAPVNLEFLADVLRQVNAWLDGNRTYASPWDTFLAPGRAATSPDGYLWTEHERFLLLLATPRQDLQDFRRAHASLARLRAAVAAVKAEHPRVVVGVTGKDALEADEMTAAMRDMTLATGLSLVGLALLMVIFFGGIRRPTLGVATLALAVCWTFGAATLLLGQLNLFSVVFTPLIMGLGIDYGVHVLVRYEEEIGRGPSVQIALARALHAVGPGIMNAAFTAAASFLALALTDFQGLRELGLICGIGILLTLKATLVVLPALILLAVTRRAAPAPAGRGRAEAGEPFRLFAYRRGGLVAAAGIGAAALSVGGLAGVGFDANPLRLQTEGAEAVAWELKLLRESNRSTAAAEVVVRSLDELRGKTEALRGLPSVARLESVFTFLPDAQVRKLELLQGLRPVVQQWGIEPQEGGVPDVEALTKVLDRIRFKMGGGETVSAAADPTAPQRAEIHRLIAAFHARLEAVGPNVVRTRLAAFERALFRDLADKVTTLRANVMGGPMTPEELPIALRQRFIGQSGAYLVRVYPREDIWEPEPLARFVAELRRVDPDVLGDPVDLLTYAQAFRRAYEQAAIYALVVIFLLILVDLRRLTHAILAMIPLLVGAAWTVGLMRVFGMDFNLANVIFLPLIVGAGAENGIIILHRWREEGTAFVGIPASTGKGVALASLTTVVGFGSLMIAHHRGVRSLGLLLTLGTVCILVASFTVLPGLLGVLARRRPAAAPSGEEVPVPNGAEDWRERA